LGDSGSERSACAGRHDPAPLREATLCIEAPDFFEYADSKLITQADRAHWSSLDPESTGRRLHYKEVGRIDCVHFPLLFNGALEDET